MAKAKSAPICFGAPAGISEGQWFEGHAELCEAGVHRALGRGIAGTASGGVDSIVLSGGYVDDVYGEEEIIYTGEGGRDRDTGRLYADQSMESSGNAGLLLNEVRGNSVRVIRGLKIRGKKRRKATGGYEYCGLFRVADHWMTVGKEGFLVCQFKLVKLAPGEVPKPKPMALPQFTDTPVEEQVRRAVEYQRLVRDSKVVHAVKEMYGNTCQMCETRLQVSPGGEAYSEAAHIRALGKPHNGPDVLENVLCLCANCHALFDRGALQLSDHLDVLDGLTRNIKGKLKKVREHEIKVEFVRQHRQRWGDRFSTPTDR
ncbi:YDG/SRA domain-containing protein [Streptomyces sp. NPDC014733]|uniref:YDG/SRA domain-containing protein n=1 Tax=Streptomyces sp. NPDC014733 TaxID=3364885 RepID=UPI0037004CDF